MSCRELGFSDALCSPRTEQGFPSLQPQDSQPALVSNIRCRGNERLLDRCPFSEFEVTATCNETAGNLLCIDSKWLSRLQDLLSGDGNNNSQE